MDDRSMMTPEQMAEIARNDEEFAAMLQKQFDEEMLELDDRSLSPDLVGHPASPIEERLSSFAEDQLDHEFGEQLSSQLLKHINKSSLNSAHLSQNGISNELNVTLADQPSTSSTSLSDEQLSEEYARRLQQEYDNESTVGSQINWDPISEWRMDDDEQLNQALAASLLEQPCSSKANFYSDTTTDDVEMGNARSNSREHVYRSDQRDFEDRTMD